MTSETPPLLRGLRRNHYRCVAADVPWAFKTFSDKGLDRSAEKHYGTMSLDDIAALDVARYCAPDCHLFFWITAPFLAKGAHLPIMMAWGFTPTAIAFTWLKPVAKQYRQGQLFLDDELFRMGMGHTTRQNAEFVVLGRRGKPERLKADVRATLIEPAREHSRKPEKFFTAVERYCEGPRLELFGRQMRGGWTVRGDEREKFS